MGVHVPALDGVGVGGGEGRGKAAPLLRVGGAGDVQGGGGGADEGRDGGVCGGVEGEVADVRQVAGEQQGAVGAGEERVDAAREGRGGLLVRGGLAKGREGGEVWKCADMFRRCVAWEVWLVDCVWSGCVAAKVWLACAPFKCGTECVATEVWLLRCA